jgi:serine protease inhibitor
MFSKKKYQKELQAKLEASTPKLEAYEALPATPKNRAVHPWLKPVVFGLGGAAVVALSMSGGLAIAKALQSSGSGQNALTGRLNERKAKVALSDISATSSAIYSRFADLTATSLLKANYQEASLAYSPVDAFIAFSMEIYASNDTVQASYCTALGAKNMGEINTAAKEIACFLGASENRQYRYNDEILTGDYGAANINSLWLDPKTPLVSDPSELLKGFSDNYYADVYKAEINSDNLNAWLSEVAPSGFNELPKLQIPSGGNAAMVSSTFLKDHFAPEKEQRYQAQYQSGNHRYSYALPNGNTRLVDYLDYYDETSGYVFNGEGYHVTSLPVGLLGISYYLPDEGNDIASLFDRVFLTSGLQGSHYKLSLEAPYFSITSDLDLLSVLPNLGASSLRNSSLEKLVDSSKEPTALVSAKQSSVLKLDYEGFYAASATVLVNAGAAENNYPVYDFKVDRPHFFKVTRDGLPLYYGVVVDPSYPAYQG